MVKEFKNGISHLLRKVPDGLLVGPFAERRAQRIALDLGTVTYEDIRRLRELPQHQDLPETVTLTTEEITRVDDEKISRVDSLQRRSQWGTNLLRRALRPRT